MASTAELIEEYERVRPRLNDFGLRLVGLVSDLLKRQNLKPQHIEQRCKESASLREKLNRPGKSYPNGIADVTDLCGVRVVLYTLSEAEQTVALLRREFSIDEANSIDKSTILQPSEFGYRSTHLILSLAPNRSALSEWVEYADLRAEVQVRTVLQHAWAAIDHTLRYKRDEEVPSAQRRALYQLSALLEVADETFSRLRTQQAELVDTAKRDIKQGTSPVELNRLTFEEYRRSSKTVELLIACAVKGGFEHEESWDLEDADPVSDLLSQCKVMGIATVRELDDALRAALENAESYFAELAKLVHGTWITDAAFTASLALLRDARRPTLPHMVIMGWTQDSARYLEIANKYPLSPGLPTKTHDKP